MLTSEQIRAARALLRLEQAQLAEKVGVSTQTIKRLEGQTGPVGANAQTIEAIQTVLRREGVEFIDSNSEGGPGVRIQPKHADPQKWLVAEVARLLAVLLESRVREDPKFFERGPVQIRNTMAFDAERAIHQCVFEFDRSSRAVEIMGSPLPLLTSGQAGSARRRGLRRHDSPDELPQGGPGVRFAQDETKRLASEFAGLFAAALEVRAQKDPQFFERVDVHLDLVEIFYQIAGSRPTLAAADFGRDPARRRKSSEVIDLIGVLRAQIGRAESVVQQTGKPGSAVPAPQFSLTPLPLRSAAGDENAKETLHLDVTFHSSKSSDEAVVNQTGKPGSRAGRASEASDMAGREIDRLGDASASVDERASRKQRLLKGPKEFRGMRGQRPKPKG
jgi:transcriptional regulator with XRE-family HTH domain